MKKRPTFTPLFDWIAERDDLTLLEKCLVSRVLRYGSNGCFESYARLANAFGMDRGTIIRAIKSLIRKDWIVVLYEGEHKRILYVPDERLSAGPLFTKVLTGSGKVPPVGSGEAPKSSSKTPPAGSGETPQSGGAAPPYKTCMIDNKREKKKEKIKTKIDSLAEVMKQDALPMSTAEFQKKQRKQVRELTAKGDLR